METVETELLLRATCARCGATTRRFRATTALLPMLLFMMSVFVDAPRGTPVLTGLVAAVVAFFLVRDIVARRRHPVATFEQIEEADAGLKKERVRIAVGEAPADDGPLAVAEAEAEAEATAQRERHVS